MKDQAGGDAGLVLSAGVDAGAETGSEGVIRGREDD